MGSSMARQKPGFAATTTLSRFHSRIARVLFLSALRASGCHWPAFPGPDGPGYWLTALRALCVTHHPEGTDWAMIWLKNCGRSGVFSTAHASPPLINFMLAEDYGLASSVLIIFCSVAPRILWHLGHERTARVPNVPNMSLTSFLDGCECTPTDSISCSQ